MYFLKMDSVFLEVLKLFLAIEKSGSWKVQFLVFRLFVDPESASPHGAKRPCTHVGVRAAVHKGP